MSDLQDWLNGIEETKPDTDGDYTADPSGNAMRFDIFKEILPALNKKDKFFLRQFPQEKQDNFEPWIIMRWLGSYESDKDQEREITFLNDVVNVHFSALSPQKTLGKAGHKELQWMLMSLCGNGKFVKRKFIKPGKGAVKNKLEAELLSHYPLLNDAELELLLTINTKEDLEQFFKDNAYDDKAIKELLKSYAKGQ